jgi:hypothetical protein
VIPTVEVSTNEMGMVCPDTGSWLDVVRDAQAMRRKFEVGSLPLRSVGDMPSAR